MKTLTLEDDEYELLQKLVTYADHVGLPKGMSLNAVVALGRKHLELFTLERQQSFEVIINGERKVVHSLLVSYEDVVAMAGKKGNPSMTYARGMPIKPEGILAPGEEVMLRDGMVFSVMHTGNA